MTFDELVQEVYTLTKRPDLIPESESAVRAATLKAHTLDFFSKDIHETGIQWDTAEYRQKIDYISLITNYRALKYVRRVEDENDTILGKGQFFTMLTPDELLDSYGCQKPNIAYSAGRVIELSATVKFQYALMGAYVFPIVTPADSYSSWVSDLYPFAIIREAARVVFKTIGKDEEAATYNQLVQEEYNILKLSNIQDIGY